MERGVRGESLTRYDRIAPDYARHRGVQPHVVQELIRFGGPGPASRILEVGCGTGAHVHSVHRLSGSTGLGVDASLGMLSQAPEPRNACLVCATAHCLPFSESSFDLVFSVNVIHHVPDPRRYFVEAHRVLRAGGLVCTFTDSAAMIRRRRPLSTYWPSSARADLERYHGLDALRSKLRSAGFEQVSETRLCAPFLVTSTEPYRDRVYSCLRLISDAEFEAGLARLESDLARGPVEGLSELVALWGSSGKRPG